MRWAEIGWLSYTPEALNPEPQTPENYGCGRLSDMRQDPEILWPPRHSLRDAVAGPEAWHRDETLRLRVYGLGTHNRTE